MCRIGHLVLLVLVLVLLGCMVRSLRMRFGKLVWLLTEGNGMRMGRV